MHAWNTGKEYGVVLVFFGCLAACTHGDLLVEQEGLQNKSVQRLLKLNGYIYCSLSNYVFILSSYRYFLSSLNNNCHEQSH